MSDDDLEVPAPVPAATVVLLRDSDVGIETLMLRRDSKLAFAGGAWVFPGGRVDPDDHPTTRPVDDLDITPDVALRAARNAAVRETREEAGLDIDGDHLEWFAHWTPHSSVARRFATWFFVARAPEGTVVIDDGEIRAHEWAAPSEVLRRHASGELELLPPTWMTLDRLRGVDTVEAALAQARAARPTVYVTRVWRGDDRVAATWDGDAAYDDGDLARPGPRHRLWLDADGWRFEHSG
ncbi:MAG: NUDIX hydrolase [Acidimicrobiia bacterium]